MLFVLQCRTEVRVEKEAWLQSQLDDDLRPFPQRTNVTVNSTGSVRGELDRD